MAGLSRVAAVYKLLERRSLAEAAAANAAVAEVEGELLATERQRTSACAQRNRAAADAVARTAAEVALGSSEVRAARLQTLLESRRRVFHQFQLAAAAKRLRVRQVEEVVLAAQRTEQTEQSRRAQADADERFLAQRFYGAESK